jgi:hypothetical protein
MVARPGGGARSATEQGDQTWRSGVEVMDYSFALLDLTVYGRQEPWEDSLAGWPQRWTGTGERIRADGRPIAHWSRVGAGRSDDLTGAGSSPPQD